MDDGRGHALADRVAEERCVRRRAAPGRRIGVARDGVYYLLAALVDGDLQPPLLPGLDQLIERDLDLLLKVVHRHLPYGP